MERNRMDKHICSVLVITLLWVACPVICASPEEIQQRVKMHLSIQDPTSACLEAYQGVLWFPDSKSMWFAYLQALAQAGDEKNMMTTWRGLIQRFPEEQTNREALEEMAWAIINKGFHSSSPNIRVIAMLGAFFSQDAKGVKILLQGLHDENSFLRAAAAKLSSNLFDASLQEALLGLLKTEKVWKVRLEVIKSMAPLRIMAAKPNLESLIVNDRCHDEEKAAAIEALVSLSDQLEPKQLKRLVASDRAGLRMLACELVVFFDETKEADPLLPFLNDAHPSVRAQTFQTLGKLRIESLQGQDVVLLAQQGVNDPDPAVAISAAWMLTIHRPELGISQFHRFLNHPIPDVRHQAAGALAATGRYGLPLMQQMFRDHVDPYVRMNVAIGLIGQRTSVQEACDCLFMGLSQQKERWSWEERPFRALAPNQVKHDEAIPNYPEAVNQLTRLEILELLAVVKYPHSQQAVKTFLQQKHWGISGMASALLLTEGDEEAVEIVESLLTDPEEQVRIQAALILALWGKGDEVVQFLQQAYLTADRELKEQILEGVGRVGSEKALPFLADCLQEPYQTIRLVAAAALLECLYR